MFVVPCLCVLYVCNYMFVLLCLLDLCFYNWVGFVCLPVWFICLAGFIGLFTCLCLLFWFCLCVCLGHEGFALRGRENVSVEEPVFLFELSTLCTLMHRIKGFRSKV